MKKIYSFIILFLLFQVVQANVIHRIIINGVINPVATEYITKSIERAESEDAEMLIIQMDTPGGLMESMHQIMKAIQSSKVPIAVYVAPSGSRAGSAGVFITYAAHIAAMAPATNIGSAHPVFGGGTPGGMQPDSSNQETLMEKVTNDAVAKIKAVAVKRGRNAEWAEKAIRESANITETEALKLHVIDYVVPTVDSLLAVVDGKEIELDNGSKKVLQTRNKTVITYEMSWRQRLLDTITNPNIAYILMMLGIYGLMFELYNPGSILPGVVGGICLLLGLYALQTLPVNYTGLLLIVFAIILFLLEIKIPSYGLLTIGGVVSLTLGSIMLFDSPLPFLQVSWQVILTVVLLSVLFFVFAIGMAIRIHRTKPKTGIEGMIGEIGEVYKPLNPAGTVKVHGEYWKATSDRPLKKGQKVKVVRVDEKSLRIHVEAVD
ncbi:MAG TPA: nodulation protein NfeD [Caldithrix abyssi]|uniref:Nodulation protein NfeD n=1 Tax=Caldithrix abyssi TaxID=187145 RepID=A0A7V4U2Y2_CALAY|nr:nodulation protein NfeD [Caldithrix abyssi]